MYCVLYFNRLRIFDISQFACMFWQWFPSSVFFSPLAGRCPAALCSVGGRWRAGRPSRWHGQCDEAIVGWQRYTELLRKVARIPTQRLCSIVSVTLLCDRNTFQPCASLLELLIFNILLTYLDFLSVFTHYKGKCGQVANQIVVSYCSIVLPLRVL